MTAKRAKRKPDPEPPPREVEFFYDVEQRSAEWFALHRGVPTASRFASVMAQGRDGDESMGRASYMQALASEIVTGRTYETFQSEAMRRGVEMEPLAREHFFRSSFDEAQLVGFVRRRLPNGRFVGCSPDCQVGNRPCGLEIKTVQPDKLIALLDKGAGGFPSRFKAQVQGTMLVTGWQEMKLLLYYAGAEGHDSIYMDFTVIREEPYIEDLWHALQVFDHDLHDLVQRTRSKLR